MNKKGVFDKAKSTGGVFEGTVDDLGKALQDGEQNVFAGWDGKLVRVAVMVPESLRWAYKAKLSALHKNYQTDLEAYILNFVGSPDNK